MDASLKRKNLRICNYSKFLPPSFRVEYNEKRGMLEMFALSISILLLNVRGLDALSLAVTIKIYFCLPSEKGLL